MSTSRLAKGAGVAVAVGNSSVGLGLCVGGITRVGVGVGTAVGEGTAVGAEADVAVPVRWAPVRAMLAGVGSGVGVSVGAGGGTAGAVGVGKARGESVQPMVITAAPISRTAMNANDMALRNRSDLVGHRSLRGIPGRIARAGLGRLVVMALSFPHWFLLGTPAIMLADGPVVRSHRRWTPALSGSSCSCADSIHIRQDGSSRWESILLSGYWYASYRRLSAGGWSANTCSSTDIPEKRTANATTSRACLHLTAASRCPAPRSWCWGHSPPSLRP